MNQLPTKCPQCGALYFHEEHYQQYIDGAYSATAGGNLIATGEPVTLRRCLSGHIFGPSVRKSLSKEEQAAFQQSMGLARKREADLDPQAILERVQQSCLSKDEFHAKLEEVKRLAACLESGKTANP